MDTVESNMPEKVICADSPLTINIAIIITMIFFFINTSPNIITQRLKELEGTKEY